MKKYEIYITCDNEDGALMRVCNFFSARGFSIETLNAKPINEEKTLSSIAITSFLPEDKIPNIKDKLLQIVPVVTVEICLG